MQRLELKLSNRKGFTLILSALLIFVFLGAAVMAVDVGHMQLRRADVHAASDAAALAGIEKYVGTGRRRQRRSLRRQAVRRDSSRPTTRVDLGQTRTSSWGTALRALCNSGSFVATGA